MKHNFDLGNVSNYRDTDVFEILEFVGYLVIFTDVSYLGMNHLQGSILCVELLMVL